MKKGISKIRLFSFFFSIVLLLSLNARLTSASGNPCNSLTFCLADAFNTSGNETVIACAGTPASVNWFNIWYNGTILNDTNGGIISKKYYNYNNGYDGAINGTNYNNELINGNTTPHCVRFVLNETFTNKTIQINGTVYNKTDYSSASSECNQNGCNGTMFTINYVSIETKNSDGSAFLPNIALMAFNNTTKTFIMNGPALTDSNGYWAEHCWGTVNQSSGACVNATPYGNISSNWCFVHSVSFPLNSQEPICPINQTTAILPIDFVSSNTSSQQNVTPGIPLVMDVGTAVSMTMVMVSDWDPNNQMTMASINSTNVYDYNTNALLFNLSSGGQNGGGPPAFIQPYALYKLNFSYRGINYNFPLMTPISGMTSAQIIIANTTSFPQNSTGYRTIVGKVVNESINAATGDYYPIAGAVVYAQFFKGPGGAFGIQFFNSSVTDSNGIFTMRIPRSRTPNENPQGGNMYFPLWQFYIVSNVTSSGIPIYFPTIDNNKNKGYFAIGDTVVLPPLTLKAGGQVNVNVTLNNASMVMSELSKFATPATGVITNGTTGKFAMTSMFSTVSAPSSMIMSLLSPTYSDANPNLVVDLFGKNNNLFGGGDPMSGSIVSACFNNTFNVTQGALSNITCNLTNVGYLNLTVQTCQDIFTQSGCNMQMQAGRFDFWFEMNGIIRNSNNQVVSYLSPEGVLLENLVGQGQSNAISIPLPPGNYTLELASPMDFSRYLGVYNRTEFVIAAGATTILNLTRANSWNIQPMFNPSLSRSDNSLNVSIMNATGNMLNNTSIILTGKVLRLSKFAANDTIIAFSYDPVRSVFYNNTFNPGSYNLNGKYLFMFNATNVTSNVYYTTNQFMPINIFDFQVGVDLGGFTFGTGQNVSAKLFAYNTTPNPPVGLNASSGNVTTTIYDESGSQVTVTTSATNLTNGQGTINITMPGTLGFYEIVTSVTTDNCYSAGCTNNTFGISDNWVQISNLNVKVSSDKQNYQTTDIVALAVQISNATNGSAITGVSVETVVDNGNTPSLGTTGSDGKAIINLNPSLLLNSTTGTWSYGWHSIRVKISGSIGTNVFKVDTWSGFDVRGFDLFIRPDKPSYGITDNVTIAAYGPLQSFSITGVKVDSTTLTQGPLDNCNVTQGVTFCIDTAWGTGSNNIKIGNWSVGHHNVEITVSFGGSQQKFYTGFDVSNYNIIVTTDSFTYNLNQNITLNIKVSYTNGTTLDNTGVNVSLWKAQPPNDIFVTTAGGTTNSTGQKTFTLNATQPGFNFIKVNVSGQLQFIGVQVSSLKVTLLNATGGSVVTNYNVMPGSTTNIYVNATSGNSNVPDGSTVTAAIWSFGNRIDLPSNTTTNGNTTIPVQIPSFAPSQVYGLEITVTTPTGEQGFAPPATLTVTGGSALQLRTLSDRSFSNPYKTGDNATLIAILSYPNGTGASGQNITFEVGSEGSRSQTIGTSVTGNDGKAASSFTITNNYTDGPYFLHAYITNSTDVQDYSGFLISSLKVNVATDRSNNTYSPGENITLNITLLNTTGSQINATNGFVFIFNKNKGQIQQTISTSGSQPYQAIIAVPNESSAIGTYPIGVIMFSNQSQGTGSAMIDVKSSSNSLNLTLPSSITAGTSFLANISSSLNGTATFRVFSPTASSLFYENTSVSLGATSTPNASINLTISNPGVYVFNAFVNGIGSTTNVITVSPPSSGTIPSVWTYTSVSNSTTNTSSFTVQDVYIMSNIANTTATILTLNTTTNTTLSYSVPLSLNSSTTYYGKLDSSNLVSGRKYFVRLDSSTSTGLSKTMFSVS